MHHLSSVGLRLGCGQRLVSSKKSFGILKPLSPKLCVKLEASADRAECEGQPAEDWSLSKPRVGSARGIHLFFWGLAQQTGRGECPRTAVTKGHSLESLNNRNCSSHSSGARSPKSRCQQGRALSEDSCPFQFLVASNKPWHP